MAQSPEHVRSKRFHDRAEECRSLANALYSDDSRRKLLEIAADYDRMAEIAERSETEDRA
jgi:hypothetical protein